MDRITETADRITAGAWERGSAGHGDGREQDGQDEPDNGGEVGERRRDRWGARRPPDHQFHAGAPLTLIAWSHGMVFTWPSP